MQVIQGWSDEETSQLLAARAQCSSWEEVSARMPGRSPNSCRNKWRTVRHLESPASQQPPAAPIVEAVRTAAVEMQFAAERHDSRPVISPQWHPEDIDLDAKWREAEEDSLKRIEKARLQSRFDINVRTNRPIAVAFVSDQHIAPGTPVDFRRMREDAELIRDTPDLYAVLGGDGVDNHIKHFSAVLAARSQPQDQWILYEHYLKILGEKLLVVTSGNHDLWTNQYAGTDMVSWLARSNRFAYAPYEARIAMTVGQQPYKLAVRHQYRLNSSFNQTHSVKQWLRLGEDDFDVGCIGHHHEAAVEQSVYRGRMVWLCRPGAYQITSSYSAVYGYNNSLPSCPTFILFPDRRHIIGVADVRDVPAILKAVKP
jgi:hypothetical protein